tara:strand:+ start:554 stop:766 length:213 start_codon:yes stop_codon:yes gene_type:complete
MATLNDKKVVHILEKYIDYSDLGKTQAMERDLHILEDFIDHYGVTMLPLLDGYIKKVMEEERNASTTNRR